MLRLQNLEQKVSEQEKEIEQLKQQVEELTWFFRRLTVSKLSDPKYPYWNWLLERNVSEEKMTLSEIIMLIFKTRYEQREIPARFRKERYEVYSDRLFSDQVPSLQEVQETIASVLDINNDLVNELLASMKDQGIMVDLCSQLLSQAPPSTE